jgi:hypothetical protein
MEHIGIDVHKNQRQICIVTEVGALLHQPKRNNAKLCIISPLLRVSLLSAPRRYTTAHSAPVNIRTSRQNSITTFPRHVASGSAIHITRTRCGARAMRPSIRVRLMTASDRDRWSLPARAVPRPRGGWTRKNTSHEICCISFGPIRPIPFLACGIKGALMARATLFHHR